ncbi:amidase, partial [Rhizobium ruizarguesonis]
RFQARHGLPADGVLVEFTLKAMNIPADVRLQQLNTNFVRLQTFPEDMGRRHLMVNIPAAYVAAEAADNRGVARRDTAVLDSLH